tara:strand:- start:299 stop:847 length:549 start_codon:yes stop_codon:yes gene_type:complete
VNINRNRLKSEKNQGSQTVKGTDQKLKKRNEADLALDLIKKELSMKQATMKEWLSDKADARNNEAEIKAIDIMFLHADKLLDYQEGLCTYPQFTEFCLENLADGWFVDGYRMFLESQEEMKEAKMNRSSGSLLYSLIDIDCILEDLPEETPDDDADEIIRYWEDKNTELKERLWARKIISRS